MSPHFAQYSGTDTVLQGAGEASALVNSSEDGRSNDDSSMFHVPVEHTPIMGTVPEAVIAPFTT